MEYFEARNEPVAFEIIEAIAEDAARDGQAETVFDWKSAGSASRCPGSYARQLALYAHVLGATRGAVVYMTTGEIQWVEAGKDT